MKKLAVCNDWKDTKSAVYWNKDGILKALQVLRDTHGWDVKFFKLHDSPHTHEHECVTLEFTPNLKKDILAWKPDAILFFSDLSRPILGEFKDVDIPKAIAFTGGLYDDYIDVPDIFFVESTTYLNWFERKGKKVVRAFGTNTELFKPYPQPKVFDTFFPATFAAWKRHDLFAEATKNHLSLTCGFWQPHEMHCVKSCQDAGVAVLHHQPAESTALLYSMSKTVLITSDSSGGSQRTVLEAMACNVPVIVNKDSEKCSEFIAECGIGEIVEPYPSAFAAAIEKWKDKEVNTRDFILENYSEYTYAQKLKDGIESIL